VLARYRDVATAGVKGKEGYEKEATKELYSTLYKAIGDRMSAMAPEDLLRVFTHDVKSASEFSEKLRVPEKAVILAESFFNEIREWLQGERVISCMVVSISWDVGCIALRQRFHGSLSQKLTVSCSLRRPLPAGSSHAGTCRRGACGEYVSFLP
jgi:hypothetical protein